MKRKLLILLVLSSLLLPVVSSQNYWVDDFDLVSVDPIEEYSPDGDPWTEGERIPVRYQVRSEADGYSYLYTWVKARYGGDSFDYEWTSVDPWARRIAPGETVWIESEIIVPDVSDGRYLMELCILDEQTEPGFDFCMESAYVEIEQNSNWLLCGGGIIAIGLAGFLWNRKVNEREDPTTVQKSWFDISK